MAESNIPLTSEQTRRKSDETKILSAARQDPRVFGDLYRLYVDQVFRYLYSRLGNVHEAEDVTAQTFLAAFEAFGRFREDRHFAPWLFTIARNKAMDHFRQQKKAASIDEADQAAVENDPLSSVIESEQSATLAKLIQALPDEERELLRLRYLAGLTFPEIAHFLHRNEEAVKKSIYRLLARLQSQVETSHE